MRFRTSSDTAAVTLAASVRDMPTLAASARLRSRASRASASLLTGSSASLRTRAGSIPGMSDHRVESDVAPVSILASALGCHPGVYSAPLAVSPVEDHYHGRVDEIAPERCVGRQLLAGDHGEVGARVIRRMLALVHTSP